MRPSVPTRCVWPPQESLPDTLFRAKHTAARMVHHAGVPRTVHRSKNHLGERGQFGTGETRNGFGKTIGTTQARP
jgi:hypothetical protein